MLVYLALNMITSPQAGEPFAASTAAQETEAAAGYRVGVSDDRVAVFHNGQLYLRTDTLLSSLPKSDRTKIENGIEVDSVKELKELLQDYCS